MYNNLFRLLILKIQIYLRVYNMNHQLLPINFIQVVTNTRNNDTYFSNGKQNWLQICIF